MLTVLIGPAALGQYILILGFGAAATVYSTSERFLKSFHTKITSNLAMCLYTHSELAYMMRKAGAQRAFCFHFGKLYHFQRITSLSAIESVWNYTLTLLITFSNC